MGKREEGKGKGVLGKGKRGREEGREGEGKEEGKEGEGVCVIGVRGIDALMMTRVVQATNNGPQCLSV